MEYITAEIDMYYDYLNYEIMREIQDEIMRELQYDLMDQLVWELTPDDSEN